MFKIGLLGAARIAPKAMIGPVSKRTDCEIVALACRDEARGKDYAKTHKLGAVDIVTDYKDLVAREDIDLIYNPLPPSKHVETTLAALEAGKHVLLEKPFSMNTSEAETMVAAAKQHNRILMEGFHYCYHPAFQKTYDLYNAKKIGSVQSIEAQFTVPIANKAGQLRYIWELGGGALMDLGCYAVHISRLIMGAEPEVISATARHEGDVDVSLSGELQFPDNIPASIHCDMSDTAEIGASIQLNGSKGTLRYDGFVAPHDNHKIHLDTEGNQETFTIESDMTTYDHQLSAFIDAVKTSTSPMSGGEDAVATMRVIDQLYEKAGFPKR